MAPKDQRVRVLSGGLMLGERACCAVPVLPLLLAIFPAAASKWTEISHLIFA